MDENILDIEDLVVHYETDDEVVEAVNSIRLTMKKGEIISDTTMTLVLHSDLIIKNGTLAEDLIIEGNWRYGQEAMTEYAHAKELYITRDLYLRRIVNEPRYKGLKDLLLRLGDSQESGYSHAQVQ